MVLLTYILIELVKHHRGPTYGELIDMIHETIDKINESGKPSYKNVKINVTQQSYIR